MRREDMEALDAGEALRVLASALSIPAECYADDGVARLMERPLGDRIGLLRAIRFFSDPHAHALVQAYLTMEDTAGRRAIATACCNIAESFTSQAARS